MSLARVFASALQALAWIAPLAVSAQAAADDEVKQACLEAHGDGQDAREQGHTTQARRLFNVCAQATCPALIRDDCARLLDEVDRAQASVSFSVRDSAGSDLPDTRVFVDGELLLAQLDGLLHEIDPGMHVVRFEHAGRQQEQQVVVGAGEKGRVIVGVFERAKAPSAEHRMTAPARRVGPAIAIGASSALLAAGGALLAAGLLRVPDSCNLAQHECAATPGDPVFRDAARAVRLSNVGWAVGGVGLAALTASLIWFVKAPRASEHAAPRHTVTPFASAQGVGVALTGRL